MSDHSPRAIERPVHPDFGASAEQTMHQGRRHWSTPPRAARFGCMGVPDEARRSTDGA